MITHPHVKDSVLMSVRASLSGKASVSLPRRVSATLRLFPGITAASARSFLSPPIKGVILEGFGAGYVVV